MKLLIISHACSLTQNQNLFAIAGEKRGWKISLVVPRKWKNEYGARYTAELHPDISGDLITPSVICNGSVPLHTYVTNARSIIRRIRPDVVYSHNEAYALSTMQWCWANKTTLNCPFGFFSCQNIAKQYPFPFRQGEAWVYKNSSFFFPITEAVEAVHRGKGYTGAATVLPLGFDPAQYRKTRDPGNRQLGPARTKIAFIGRVVEEKGLLTLSKALSTLGDLNWELTIIGAGPYEATLREAHERDGISHRVIWRGFIPHKDAAAAYESVDLVVLPSESRSNWKEQFGRVLVEAMACGTPVVGSSSGEIPNIIRQSGGGLVFEEQNPTSCAQVLRQFITTASLRAKLAMDGMSYVHQHYALPALAEKFAKAIEGVAS